MDVFQVLAIFPNCVLIYITLSGWTGTDAKGRVSTEKGSDCMTPICDEGHCGSTGICVRPNECVCPDLTARNVRKTVKKQVYKRVLFRKTVAAMLSELEDLSALRLLWVFSSSVSLLATVSSKHGSASTPSIISSSLTNCNCAPVSIQYYTGTTLFLFEHNLKLKQYDE